MLPKRYGGLRSDERRRSNGQRAYKLVFGDMPGSNAVMKMKSILIAIAAATLTLSSTAFAQTTQMTGKVVAVTSEKITLQNGNEVWEINLTASTKVSGDKKVGSTVTVTYNAPDAAQKKE